MTDQDIKEAAEKYSRNTYFFQHKDALRDFTAGAQWRGGEEYNRAIDDMLGIVTAFKLEADRFYAYARDSESAAESSLCDKLIEELKKLKK